MTSPHLKCILVHLLCQVSIWSTRNFSYLLIALHPQRPTFQVVTEVDLIPQRIAKNNSHKLPVRSPLHILSAVAVRVARVMFEGKRDPDGLTTWTTQSTSSKSWRFTVFIPLYKVPDMLAYSLGLALPAGLFWAVFPSPDGCALSSLLSLYWSTAQEFLTPEDIWTICISIKDFQSKKKPFSLKEHKLWWHVWPWGSYHPTSPAQSPWAQVPTVPVTPKTCPELRQ